ncbi:MAG: hypothetical protein AMXMBFR76_02610 [Pseudomonadota bacterium]
MRRLSANRVATSRASGGQACDADGEVITLGCDVHHAIGQVRRMFQMRVRAHEGEQHRPEAAGPEAHRRADAQQPHAVWHLFVLTGSACHFVALLHPFSLPDGLGVAGAGVAASG